MLEINKLAEMLEAEHIPFERYVDGTAGAYRYHILYPAYIGHVCSVIQGYGTYGNDDNMLEAFGLTADDDVEGWLTAQDVFGRIKKHWEQKCS